MSKKTKETGLRATCIHAGVKIRKYGENERGTRKEEESSKEKR